MGKFKDLLDDMSMGKKSPLRQLSSAKIIALGYLIIILAGTGLLMIPAASRGEPPVFYDALFTSVSATCVTGLLLFDTYTQWSVFGQIIIIILVQIGGIGFMTIISLMAMATGRKIGLRERSILQESVNNTQLGGIVRLVRKIAFGTLICEGVGAVLLAVRFIPKMGAAEGIGNAVFMSISAFCNAGFDLNGKYGQYCSMMPFREDVLVNLTVCALVFIGGIGFAVWDDIIQHKLKLSSYKLHSKIALSVTLVLTAVGTLLFFLFESENTLAGMGFGDKLMMSFYNSVMPRTAGFSLVDINDMSPASKMLTLLYMFIGGSPGSAAGGIKTVTIAVLIASAAASMLGNEDINIFGRRLEHDVNDKAVTVITVNLLLAISAVLIICAVQPELESGDVILEVMSAVTTAGVTSGITRQLSGVSRAVIMLLMYCGRVGSVSFALVFTRKKAYTGVQNPIEQISVG